MPSRERKWAQEKPKRGHSPQLLSLSISLSLPPQFHLSRFACDISPFYQVVKLVEPSYCTIVVKDKNSMESTLKKPRTATAACGDTSEKADRISNLPDAILHYILLLSSLKMIDVVRTSVLSRRWRYLWNSFPYVDLDLENYFFSRSNDLLMDYRGLTTAFNDFINWVLINGTSDYQKFRLSCSDVYDNETVARWVIVASRRNVQELTLKFCPFEAFEMPYSLVTSESLRVLKLNLFLRPLKLPCSVGFRRLTSLDLAVVEVSDERLAQNLFSSCPLLENLRLINCVLNKVKVLDISSASLKYLTIENYDLTLENNSLGLENGGKGEGLCESKLKISCPYLVSFKYLGPIAQEYSLENLSSLSYASIFLVQGCQETTSFEEDGYLLCNLLKGLHHTTVLKLCTLFLEFLYEVLGEAACFSTPLLSLMSLKLSIGFDGCHKDVMIHLLKYSPNLEALMLIFDENDEFDDWRMEDEDIPCLKYHLKTVELIHFEVNKSLLELVHFFLKNGHVLEKLIITWAEGVERSTMIIETISKFPMASTNVEVAFMEPNLGADFFSI